jgi:predicted nucleic acid-binding protein
MLVVADATPLNVLIRLGLSEILATLYGEVVIPPAVAAELTHAHAPIEVREWIHAAPAWLSVRRPVNVDPSLVSGAGECEAISLALELHADFLLVDDKEARTVARRLNLPITGTVGILALAAARGLVELPSALKRLQCIGFYIDEEIIQRVIRSHSVSRHESL